MNQSEIFDREFLEIRAKILQLAASFDRIDRADGDLGNDPRAAQIRQGLETLSERRADRAEAVQLIFSRVYESGWKQKFGLDGGGHERNGSDKEAP